MRARDHTQRWCGQTKESALADSLDDKELDSSSSLTPGRWEMTDRQYLYFWHASVYCRMGADGWPSTIACSSPVNLLFISLWELSNLQDVDDLGLELSDLEERITGTIKPTGHLIYLVGIC